jgi:hypothetical protein
MSRYIIWPGCSPVAADPCTCDRPAASNEEHVLKTGVSWRPCKKVSHIPPSTTPALERLKKNGQNSQRGHVDRVKRLC